MTRLLILGGTGFVGRHITEAAIDAGHHVTLFNRGSANPPDIEARTGDRDAGDYESLRSGEGWDACIDVNAYVPRAVRQAIDALDGRVDRYTFISTVSVYQQTPAGPITEASPVTELPADKAGTETVDGATYGPLKVECERTVLDAFGDRATVVRPGIVAGPHDPTDRFTYWVRRCAAGGEVLVPDRPDQPVQVVHARDQADFVVRATVSGIGGVFNSVGPTEPLTLRGLVEACAAATGAAVEPVWVGEEFLAAEGVFLPLCLPAAAGADGLFEASSEAARGAGLVNRSIVETARDTLQWDPTRDQSVALAGMTRERERELLERWAAR